MHGHQEHLVHLKRMKILISMELTQYLSLRVENIYLETARFLMLNHIKLHV